MNKILLLIKRQVYGILIKGLHILMEQTGGFFPCYGGRWVLVCPLVFKTSRWALVASWVGSIPTYSRQYIKERAGSTVRSLCPAGCGAKMKHIRPGNPLSKNYILGMGLCFIQGAVVSPGSAEKA